MRILDRHIRVALLGMCLIVALALTGITGFVTLVEELDDLGQGQYTLELVGLVAALKLPQLLYEMFPLVVLLGTILGLGGLAAAGELVVMQAAGVSVYRLAWSAGKAGLLLGLLALVLGEFVVPISKQAAENISSQARFGQSRSEGRAVWLRQGEQYIRIGELAGDSTARDVQVMQVNLNDSRLVRNLHIEQADYVDGVWLTNKQRATEIDYGQIRVRESDSGEWVVDLDPDVLKLFVLRADSLSLSGLMQYIGYLNSNGLDDTKPQFALWKKMAVPLTVMVMVFLAVPFVLGPLRDSGAGQRLFMGVMIGIGFYVLNEVAGSLGQVYRWPAPLAALMPTLLLASVAAWRLRQVVAR
ncbi:MAG: LPS export ABC transporter permease LptG [Oceanococcus sp.]